MFVSKTGTLTTAADTVALKLGGDKFGTIALNGTYTTAVVIFEASIDGTIWYGIPVQDKRTGKHYSGVSTTLVNSTSYIFTYAVAPEEQVRVRLVSIGTGSVSVKITNDNGQPLTTINEIMDGVGMSSSTIAAGTTGADFAIFTGPCTLNRFVVTTAGTASIYFCDHPTTSSGANILFGSSDTYTLGTVTEINMPAVNGLVAVKANGSAAGTIYYTPH